MTNRLFVAVNVPDDVKEQIISIRNGLYQSSEKVKWERKEKLHFTIKFLGDVEEFRNQEIISALFNQLKNQKKIECEFDKFGFFNKRGKPAILWLGLKFNQELNLVAEKVDNSLAELGFEKEKRNFKPHLTLLRIRGYENISELMKFKDYNLPVLAFTCSELILVKSILKPESSVYYNIEKFKFI
jgi:2'-5' RNA ligase